jgi:O-antigen ligase
MMGYLGREGMLRAVVTAGQPIALGYLMVVGFGLFLFVQHSIKHKLIRRLGMALLFVGAIAPLSRGPWVGAAMLLVVFITNGRYATRRLMSLTLAAIIALPLLYMVPGGEKVINLLPFIGSTEKENIDYREKLIINSMIVIKRNPWFGSVNYWNAPEMQSMRQGQGIIDVVNTYIQIALEKGYMGLALFVGFFVMILRSIFRAMHSISDRDSEVHLLGRVLLATLSSILVIIFTVSSITIIPIVYWSVAGLGVAYVQMVQKNSV